MKWPVKQLGDIAKFTNGGTPTKEKSEFWRGNILWISSADISDGLIATKRHYITNNAIASSATNLVKAGTLLVVTRTGVGKTVIADEDLCFSQDITAVNVSTSCDVRYIKSAIDANKKYLTDNARGATIKGITREVIENLKFPFPPLVEQQRIAALLDTAEHMLRLRESAIAKLDQLTQSVFVDMFSNCTNFESIKSVLLKKKISQPDVNQHVWSLSLDQIESDTGSLQNKVMVEFDKLGSSTYYFEPPVILYSKLRPYLNKVFMPTDCGYATTELVPLYCNEKKVLPIYLLVVLRQKRFVEFASINSGGAKMPRVIMDKFWDYEFAVPSIQQQQKFADFFTSIQIQKSRCLNAYKLNQALLSSIQSQSFSVN
jgi:type I restriction enzyme S subunit